MLKKTALLKKAQPIQQPSRINSLKNLIFSLQSYLFIIEKFCGKGLYRNISLKLVLC